MTTIVGALPYTFVNGPTNIIDATQVNANFNTIATDINTNGAGNGTNADITELAGTGAGVPIAGTVTNDNAASGFVGEYVHATLAQGSAINMAQGTTYNVTSISLTAGDWDVDGTAVFAITNDPIGNVEASISTVSGTINLGSFGTAIVCSLSNGASQGLFYNQQLPTGRVRLSLGSATTVYLCAVASLFVAGAACAVYGGIQARRAR